MEDFQSCKKFRSIEKRKTKKLNCMLFMFWINKIGFLIGLEEYRIQCKEYPMTPNQQ